MAFALRKRGPSTFERAADGSMTLIEHVRELRNRLFRASLAIVGGLIIGFLLADPVFLLRSSHTASSPTPRTRWETARTSCSSAPTDRFLLKLKLALWLGLIIGAPVWLYQLWAFIAPGLHRHERK